MAICLVVLLVPKLPEFWDDSPIGTLVLLVIVISTLSWGVMAGIGELDWEKREDTVRSKENAIEYFERVERNKSKSPKWSDTRDEIQTLTLITSTNVNLRAGPGTNYEVIILVPADSLVSIFRSASNPKAKHARQGNWIKVYFSQKVGWMHGAYLRPPPTSEEMGDFRKVAIAFLEASFPGDGIVKKAAWFALVFVADLLLLAVTPFANYISAIRSVLLTIVAASRSFFFEGPWPALELFVLIWGSMFLAVFVDWVCTYIYREFS